MRISRHQGPLREYTFVGITSCTKDGPAGPQGAKGDKGDKGDKGNIGATGTANVIHSNWMKLGFSGNAAVIDAPRLTQDIIDKGEINVYVKSPNVVRKLNIEEGGGHYATYVFFKGNIFIYSDIYNDYDRDSYRYILIPGGVPARKANINWDNYSEVCKSLGTEP
ncbi:hypothetical protein [Chitinophaga polysaccharea]|uniref:hypothetical protein n=1 Tax=Chitinophaga polysaccharea TaxID=1293035 RepID=UPI00115A6B7E|nr:hypothetical protein [Chitinophaga polysaccharea]